MLDESIVKTIYAHLADDESKKIVKDRLMYSLTGDETYIHNTIRISEGGLQLLRTLRFHDSQRKVIFGAGFWGRRILRFFPEEKWCCFVDNNVLSGTLIDGLKVINADELRQSFSDVFVVVANRFHYGEIEHQLLDAGFSPQNIVSTGRLSDEMTAEQYFEHGIMNPQDDEAFVDCGAYDGTTSELFMKWSGNDKSTAYAFEPDPDMAKRCRERLSGYRNAHVEASGVWDKNATLKFSADGACSTVNDSENEDLSGDEVRVVSLDDALKGKKATIIKMDVEGSERNALIGAKNIIASQKPRLAISIYHKPEDIWELPRLILEINPNYIFYLRHYTLCEYDTVLYAVQGEEQHEIHGIDKYKRAE